MKKVLSLLCLLGLLVMPLVACAPEEPEDDVMDVEVTEEPLETEMDEGMEEMEEEMDEMGTDMEEGMEEMEDEMEDAPPAE